MYRKIGEKMTTFVRVKEKRAAGAVPFSPLHKGGGGLVYRKSPLNFFDRLSGRHIFLWVKRKSYSGCFWIFAKRRGYWAGVGEILRISRMQ